MRQEELALIKKVYNTCSVCEGLYIIDGEPCNDCRQGISDRIEYGCQECQIACSGYFFFKPDSTTCIAGIEAKWEEI